MPRVLCVLLSCIVSAAQAAENPNDRYAYRLECPQNGPLYASNRTADAYNFVRCQCTSYVSHKLNEFWGNTNPKFTNQFYGITRWGNAYEWFKVAKDSHIGITGARDNFVWEEQRYNAVFPGDVALWERKDPKNPNDVGHVAYVEAVGQDAYGKGVAWVEVSEYNFKPGYEYSRRKLYKSQHPNPRFPDYFLHIDKDRIYCLANPTVDSCPKVFGNNSTSSKGKYVGGYGGGSNLDPFNLEIDFDILKPGTTQEWIAGKHGLDVYQKVRARVDITAKDGSTAIHMRPGKDTVEVDIYARVGLEDWVRLHRGYILASKLTSGTTKSESVEFMVPGRYIANGEVSFKAKIDAEDEAYESNEADNWSRIEIFTVNESAVMELIPHL